MFSKHRTYTTLAAVKGKVFMQRVQVQRVFHIEGIYDPFTLIKDRTKLKPSGVLNQTPIRGMVL